MSNSIEQIIQQIENEIQVNEKGQGKATIRAAARLADVSPESISKALLSVHRTPSKLAQLLMGRGFEAVHLASWAEVGIPDIAIAIILKYYAYQAGRYCTQQAKDIDNALSAISIRTWMQQIKGWQEPQPKLPPQPQLPPAQEIQIQSQPVSMTPAQMFFQVAQRLLEQEQEQMQLKLHQQELNQRLATFEQVQAEALTELIALPPASTGVPEESLDMKIRRIVGNYCSATGLAQGEVWRNLYQQFRLRYRRVVKKQDKETTLQAFVRLGLIAPLYDLASELLAQNNTVVQFRRHS